MCFIKLHDCYSDNCENCQGHNNIEVFLSALKNVDAVTYASWASRNIRSYKDEVIDSGADAPGILRELDNRFFKIHMCNIYQYSELKRNWIETSRKEKSYQVLASLKTMTIIPWDTKCLLWVIQFFRYTLLTIFTLHIFFLKSLIQKY